MNQAEIFGKIVQVPTVDMAAIKQNLDGIHRELRVLTPISPEELATMSRIRNHLFSAIEFVGRYSREGK